MSTQEKLRKGEDLNVGQDHAEDMFRSHPDLQDVDKKGDDIIADHDAARGAIKDGEKKAVGDTAAGKAAIATASAMGTPVVGAAAKILGKIKVNKTGGGIAATVLIVGLIISAVSFVSLSLGPIAFFTNILDDLNDQLPSLDRRMSKMLSNKAVSKADRDKLISGCKKMSIRCKFKSLSKRDIKRLQRAGITVDGKELGIGPATRTFPESYKMEIDGKEHVFSPSELAAEMNKKGVSHVKTKVRTAFNMRSLGYVNKAYAWMMGKLGISKKEPKLTGTVDEDVKAVAKGKTRPVGDLTVKTETGKDANGNDTTTSDKIATTDKGMKIAGQLGDIVGPAFKATVGNMLKAFLVTGAVDMACSLKNMIGAAAVVARYAKGVSLAQYAAPISALAWKVKSNDASPHEAEVVGKLLTKTDQRKSIDDPKATYATYQSGGDSGISDQKMDNPYYNKNALDGTLTKMSSISGTPAISTEATEKYSLGLSLMSLLGVVAGIAALIDTITPLNSTTCQFIQNWVVRGVSAIVSALAWLTGVGEGISAYNVGIVVAAFVVMIIIQASLSMVLSGNPVPDDIDKKPEEIQAALWTAKAFDSGEAAKTNGLIPGTDEQIMAYSKELKATNLAYDSIDSQGVSWNDTKSQYSLVSRLAMSMNSVMAPSSNTGSGYLASAAGLVGGAISLPLKSSSASAASINPARLKKCKPDPWDAYNKAGPDGKPIALDIQCNVRYHMPAADLELDTEKVAQYMEDNDYVEKDTETGLPKGYTLPEAGSSDNLAVAFVKGTVQGLIDQYYSTRNYVNDYGKYLDWCAYRTFPWGETFQESSGIGSAGEEWTSGQKCMEQSEMMSNFRIYTLDKTVGDITEPGDVPGQTVLTGASSGGGGSLTPVSGTDQELAKKILDSGKVTFTGDQNAKAQITAYANGNSSCHINSNVLKLLASLSQKHSFGIYSLVRNEPTGAICTGTGLAHHNGGSIDFDPINGVKITPSTANDPKVLGFLRDAVSILPSGSGIGQAASGCRTPGILNLPSGIIEFDDACTHIHIQVSPP